MANSPIIASDATSGGATIVNTSGFKVAKGGFGPLYGDEHGAHAGEVHYEGALRPLTPVTGKFQTHVLSTEDSVHPICRATVNANTNGVSRLQILGGLKGCIFTHVIIKRPYSPTGAPLVAGSTGRLFMTPTNTEESAVHLGEIDLSGLTGYGIRRVAAIEKLSEPVNLYWRPGGTRSPAGTTFILEAWGYTEWYANLPKPLATS
ncbi:hypothetical protein [Methylobacterium sp. E-045]|uniref:hypothetical protein n=1 Tax=Methylobacterium sp. E-045 TaxID=2836575 RepID=UPI001FB8C7F5|nr:hypothetical protein [Methylobacterium sp. E-045]MCJ2127338.1 hypothetical protein [Methylobacterium sp. E-045]